MNNPFEFLNKEPGPKHLIEALRHIGVREIIGGRHNPLILAWADELNPIAAGWFDTDEKPWCGVYVGVCLKRAGWDIPGGYDALRALQYAKWGIGVSKHLACIGDVGVFEREGGGHVGFLVGEDQLNFHVLGGNQRNAVNIAKLGKERLHAIRRPIYRTFQPRKLPFITAAGAVSQNEA